MTEQYYNHPGEVREALNFQCLHCNDIFTAPQGLDGHLSRVHKINPQNIRHKRDWDVTTNVAGDYTPVENRNPSIYSGDRRMKSRREKTHNLKCLVCNKVYSSSPGMSAHQQTKHGQGARRDVNWEWTTDPVTINDLRSRAAQERKGIVTAATPAATQSRTDTNVKCLRCGRVLGSQTGMVGHIRRKHREGAKKGVNWERTNEPRAQEKRGRTSTTAKPRQQREPISTAATASLTFNAKDVVLTDDKRFLEIPAIIRLPLEIEHISIGQIMERISEGQMEILRQ